MSTYRYSINGHSVLPLMGDDMNKDYDMESGQRFFRTKLSGKVSFTGDDFDYLHSQPFDTDFIFLIERYASGAWTDYVKSKFNKTDCKWDLDDKLVEVTMNPYDEYNAVIEGLDKEYNLIELAPEIESLIITKRPLIQVYIPGESVLSCFVGGTYWEQDCSEIEVESELSALHFVKASQLIMFELFGECTPVDILSAYAGKTSGQYLGNAGYRLSYSATPEEDEYGNPTGQTIYRYTILRISDEQAMFENVGYGLPLRNEVTLLPVAGSGATGELIVYGRLVDVWMRYLLDVTELSGIATHPIPVKDITDNNRNYKYCLGYNFDLASITARYSTTPTKWGKNDYGTYFREPYSISGERFYPIARSNWGNASIWFNYDLMDYVLEEKARKPYKLKDAYAIDAVIRALLAVVAPTISHEATTEYSEFLYGSTNPVSLEQSFKVFLTQKTNITAGDYDKPAQKAPVTLGEVLNMLRDVFRCFWYIEDNKLKIEHISWFDNGGSYSGTPIIGTDLTTMQYRKNGKKWGFDTSSWEFEKSSLPERIEYNWMDSVSDAFNGYPIEVENKYVSKGNVENIQLSKFTTDVDYMLFNPSGVSQDGFALLAGVKDNLYDPLANNALGYVLVGQYLTLDPNYNTTDYMAVAPGEAYVGEKLIRLNWYDAAKVFITSIMAPVDGTQYVAPSNAAFARVSVATGDWNTFLFRNASYTLPFVNFTFDGADLRLQNGLLSWLVLHPKFHIWDVPAINVKVNGEAMMAFGAKKSKKQNIEFPSSDDPNLYHLIKTYLGNGQIEKISINLASQMNKITLKYDTE